MPRIAPSMDRNRVRNLNIYLVISIKIRFSTMIPNTIAPISSLLSRSGLRARNTITAAIPYGVTIVGNASGLMAMSSVGIITFSTCADGVANCFMIFNRATRKRTRAADIARIGIGISKLLIIL